jgi:hypothetical protein
MQECCRVSEYVINFVCFNRLCDLQNHMNRKYVFHRSIFLCIILTLVYYFVFMVLTKFPDPVFRLFKHSCDEFSFAGNNFLQRIAGLS